MKKITVFLLYAFFVMPLLSAQQSTGNITPFSHEYEKNGCTVNMEIDNTEFPYFGGAVIHLSFLIPENFELEFTEIKPNSKYDILYSGKRLETEINGPLEFSEQLKLQPFQYGNIKFTEIIFHYKGPDGPFEIYTDPVLFNIISLLNNESKLLDLSMPDFKKATIPWYIWAAILVILTGAAAIILTRIIKRKKVADARTSFWEKWEQLHTLRESPKRFYSVMTGIIKEYASLLSGINYRARPFADCVKWIFSLIGDSGQLQHDFSKAAVEWERIKFKKKHVTEIYWRDDLNLVKKIINRVEQKNQENDHD